MTDINTTPAQLEQGHKVKAGVRTTITVSAKELCIIVGAENHYNTYGLKMMFFAPAVRDILSGKDQYDAFRILYFPDGYNDQEIQHVINSLKEIDVTITAVNSISEMLTELNCVSPVCKIQRLNIYAHGYPLQISFNLDGSTEDICRFSMEHVEKIDNAIFRPGAELWSYACRTGNAVPDDYAADWVDRIRYFEWDFEYDEGFKSDADAKREQSLAQALANHSNITVHAWLTRTLYERIWNDQGNQQYRNGFVEIPHPGADGGWSREMKSLIPFMNEEDKDDLILWNQQGAKNGITGARSPKGLSNTPFTFVKQ